MILAKVLENGDLQSFGKHFASYAALELAVKKAPADFDSNTKYVLITPSRILITKPETVTRLLTTAEDFPGTTPRVKKPEPIKEKKKN